MKYITGLLRFQNTLPIIFRKHHLLGKSIIFLIKNYQIKIEVLNREKSGRVATLFKNAGFLNRINVGFKKLDNLYIMPDDMAH